MDDGSCKAYGESLLHSKKQVEHEKLRLAKTVGRLTNSYKGRYKRRQTHRFCSCIDGPLKAPPLTLFHYKRTRPVVNNCIPTPFLAFQPPGPWRGIVIFTRPFSRHTRMRWRVCLYFRFRWPLRMRNCTALSHEQKLTSATQRAYIPCLFVCRALCMKR